ncbi:hypothetical protein EDB85DRAFT_1551670 [Lactarius pseudohatsudake]|nr:hypothetical protein EDB85DRAFT_602132 [Lactarius pseudohatsudake]KAH9029048.1 hypothetical protein EDB85DRAFT_1551670 [Lactarius pseudohatsudake]
MGRKEDLFLLALALFNRSIVPFSQPKCLRHIREMSFATSKDTHSVPLDYSSYQANLQHLEEVVVALERVRFYFGLRCVRASIDQLLRADPQLGHEFAVINRSLEELTKYIPPSDKLRIDGSGADDLRVVVPIGGRLLLKQRSQLKERDGLISQFRALPGFDSFLTSPRFDLFRSAANS